MNWIALMISSTFFTGFLPGKILGKEGAGGGLMGSLVGLAIQVWLVMSGIGADWAADGILISGSFALGLIFVEAAEAHMLKTWGPGKRHTGEIVEHDRNQTNIDEVHGQAIAGLPVFLLPMGSETGQIAMLVFALVAFRFFDVLKP